MIKLINILFNKKFQASLQIIIVIIAIAALIISILAYKHNTKKAKGIPIIQIFSPIQNNDTLTLINSTLKKIKPELFPNTLYESSQQTNDWESIDKEIFMGLLSDNLDDSRPFSCYYVPVMEKNIVDGGLYGLSINDPQVCIKEHEEAHLLDPNDFFIQFSISNIGTNIIQIDNITIHITKELPAIIYDFFDIKALGGPDVTFIGEREIPLNNVIKKVNVGNIISLPRIELSESVVFCFQLKPEQEGLYKIAVQLLWHNIGENKNIDNIIISDTVTAHVYKYINCDSIVRNIKSAKIMIGGLELVDTNIAILLKNHIEMINPNLENLSIKYNNLPDKNLIYTVELPINCKKISKNIFKLMNYYNINSEASYRVGPIAETLFINKILPEEYAIFDDSILIVNSKGYGIQIIRDKKIIKKYIDKYNSYVFQRQLR